MWQPQWQALAAGAAGQRGPPRAACHTHQLAGPGSSQRAAHAWAARGSAAAAAAHGSLVQQGRGLGPPKRCGSSRPASAAGPSDRRLARLALLSTRNMFLRASSTVPRPCSRCTASSSISAMAVSRGLSPTCGTAEAVAVRGRCGGAAAPPARRPSVALVCGVPRSQVPAHGFWQHSTSACGQRREPHQHKPLLPQRAPHDG